MEGSTELWEANKSAMDAAIDLHDAIMRAGLRQHCGHEISTEGDAFMLAFHSASDAVAYAVSTQQVGQGGGGGHGAIAGVGQGEGGPALVR